MTFKVVKKKVLTRPVLKFVENEAVYVKLVGQMHLGKDIKEKKADDEKKNKEPATLIDCINLVTGEEAQIIASAVIKSVLEDNYPNHSYVGLCFEMTKKAKQPGKQYNPVHIEEIEDPTPKASAAEAPKAEADTSGQPAEEKATPARRR